jgi:serine/threonine protein kinase
MYTPGFAAPELHTKKDLGPWTDIYSLGAAMFNCMTGCAPQAANERKTIAWKRIINRAWVRIPL